MIINRSEPGRGLAGTFASVLGGDLPVAIRAFQVPEVLFGKEGCDRCGPPLQMLAEGRLSKEGLDAFIRYVESNGRQMLIPELRRAWENPVAQAASTQAT